MITLKDCLDYCELSKKTVDAMAEHDHEPIIVSIAHSEYLLSSKDGRAIMEEYSINGVPVAYKVDHKKSTGAYKRFKASHKHP